ncbi:hypothetical protein BH24ACT1_BH24ACT1_12450 [soil metagenome]
MNLSPSLASLRSGELDCAPDAGGATVRSTDHLPVASNRGRLRRHSLPATLASLLLGTLAYGCVGPEMAIPECQTGGRLAVLAQAVPSASMVPCVTEMPVGWSFAALDVDSGRARFWLDSDRAGLRALEVELLESCDTTGATVVDAEEEGIERHQRLTALSPRFTGTTYDVFTGGCVAYRYELTSGAHIGLHEELHDAVALFPRPVLADELRRDLDLELDP